MDAVKPKFTIKRHFQGKQPAVRQTYDRLLKAIRQMGPVVEEPKKTSIHLGNTTALAGVATRKDYLILTIKSERKLASPRVHKTEPLSVGRYHVEVKLAAPAEVDEELVGWLRAAYALSA
jgi:Domain of unknown function (DUF5655)